MTYPHNYLVEVQYLGFRFHGWARQPNVKTVQYMIERTLNYVLDGKTFKILGTSRTDAMVSALHSGFQLFLHEPLRDPGAFLESFNENLPADIRATAIRNVPPEFNIIQSPRSKEYVYSFYLSSSADPFYAPFMTCLPEDLDIELMRKGCELYVGRHDFRNFTIKANETCVRIISDARIEENNIYEGAFFPDNKYMFCVSGAGFMRQQVRLMMGQLIKLGQGMISLDQFERCVNGDPEIQADYVAPASGLLLKTIDFGI